MTTNSQVFLSIDEVALRKSLRHAFANHDTCVQELMQNARRAGASRVELTYDVATKTLIVTDDGIGITDFDALMRIGGSGWSDEVARIEKPFGMGFFAALTAASQVSVESSGKVLSFNTEDALAVQGLDLIEAPAAEAVLKGAVIKLVGFEWQKPDEKMSRMACGFPIPVFFNGKELARPDALDECKSLKIEAGHAVLRASTYSGSRIRVYLQGFCVMKPKGWFSSEREVIVVHLDSTKFTGKLPDRDRVIDEDAMIEAVQQEVRKNYVERLQDMKRTLEPLQFCIHGYNLADSLSMLAIFNDVNLVPAAWLGAFSVKPYHGVDTNEFLVEIKDREFVTRDELMSGEVQVAQLGNYFAEESEPEQCAINRAWLYAYSMQMLVADKRLQHEHWLYTEATVNDETVCEIKWGTVRHEGKFKGELAVWLDNQRVIVVDELWIESAGGKSPVSEAIFDAETASIVVPMPDKNPAWVDQQCLLQIYSYKVDDAQQEDDLDVDERHINSFIAELVADSPEQRVEIALAALLRGTSSINSQRFTVEIDKHGIVKVTDLVQLEQASQDEPAVA